MLVVFCGMMALAGCGGDDSGGETATTTPPVKPPAAECKAWERRVDDGTCLPPGTQDNGCAAGEILTESGVCRAAGIDPAACAAGFVVDDGGGCSPILPSEPCEAGMMALVGETRCREVAPCGSTTWGDVEIEPDTQYVDASYVGTDSDGTANKPWPSIGAAMDAASKNGLIAIAAGSYAEDVEIALKPVRLWGRCPRMVEVVGSSAGIAAISITNGASGTVVRGLSVRGAALGIATSGATNVVVDHVWIHDTAGRGFDSESTLGPSEASLSDSLVEAAGGVGVAALGATATIRNTVVRATERTFLEEGRGIVIQDRDTPETSTVVEACVVERNHEGGIFVAGALATIEATVVRDTLPTESENAYGRGIDIQNDPSTQRPSTVTIRASVVIGSHDGGILVQGSNATIESTVVRDTVAAPADLRFGDGIFIQGDSATGQRANVTVRGSLVERSASAGISVNGADVTIESTAVRDIQPNDAAHEWGRGISVQDDWDSRQPSTAAIRWSTVDRVHEVGIIVQGSDATIEATAVRGTQPQPSDGRFGGGIAVELDPETALRSTATIRYSIIDDSHEFGLMVLGSDATVDATLVRGTKPRASDGNFGDNVSVLLSVLPASANANITASTIAGGTRAGLSCFGATTNVSASLFDCNAITLDAEILGEAPATFSDNGGNACGCGDTPEACTVLSSMLAPPEPLSSTPHQ
jgi:hypothetical protein